ncbi:MAG: ABC transporter permease [Bacteroidota bacterium]
MNKVFLIVQREFLSRVQKRSFLITTILVPLIIPAVLAGMIYLMVKDSTDGPERVLVHDESGLMTLTSTPKFTFVPMQGTREQAKEAFAVSDEFALIHIPAIDIHEAKGIELFTRKNPGMEKTSALEEIVSDRIRELKLEAWKIDPEILKSIRKKVTFDQKVISEAGEESDSSTGLLFGLGMGMGIIIYMLVLLYGMQIMLGVIEEKSSKIVEVLVSTVRPFQLMLGKIMGIAAVGLLQFIIWIVLITSVSAAVTSWFGIDPGSKVMMEQAMKNNPDAELPEVANGEIGEVLSLVWDLPLVSIAAVFLFYFIGGYLMYGALFAAVGASVESVQESQQFQFPVTLPLLIGYMGLFTVILRDPHAPTSFWLSIIPFTSPVAMVGRIAFGVPAWELALSMVLLIAGFFFTTWVASRIYRVGILMTGTKVTWRTLYQWAVMKV